ncbi:unnamed protein product [Prorocentrum cordatum]|uniref:Uncharacterized protein n=1 Tax=Prorocentrum cordatum TaxID=2364126 RepID=A0ABN9XAL5_9DINO|nr:unnamed protein product [Polarella glacialis]
MLDFDYCCDARAVALAARVRRRWKALLSGRPASDAGQGAHAPEEIVGCHAGGDSPANLLRQFQATSSFEIFQNPLGAEGESLKSRRLLWRIGRLDEFYP